LRWPATRAEDLVRAALDAPNTPIPFRRPFAPKSRAPRIPRAWKWSGLAVSLFGLAVLAWLALFHHVRYHTKVGEQRTVLLKDGSRVTLNTASVIEVHLSADRREVRLHSGEALFEVAHDPSRPFEVHTGNAVARAVGTQFDVFKRGDSTVVTVIEGRVVMLDSVAALAQPGLPALTRGDRVIVHNEGGFELTKGIDTSEATAWLRQQLIVRRRPLGEVAEEFNRYNVGRLDIRSPALRAEPITGTFQSNDPGPLVSFLAGIPGVQIVRDGSGGYVVTLSEGSE
jgi:transmembrane sensor